MSLSLSLSLSLLAWKQQFALYRLFHRPADVVDSVAWSPQVWGLLLGETAVSERQGLNRLIWRRHCTRRRQKYALHLAAKKSGSGSSAGNPQQSPFGSSSQTVSKSLTRWSGNDKFWPSRSWSSHGRRLGRWVNSTFFLGGWRRRVFFKKAQKGQVQPGWSDSGTYVLLAGAENSRATSGHTHCRQSAGKPCKQPSCWRRSRTHD